MTHIFATYTKDWLPLIKLVAPLWYEYADRHGYAVHFAETAPIFPEHYSFTKTAEVARYLREQKPELLWVIDLDMIPTHMAEPAAIHLKSGRSCPIQLTYDINGLNSGSFFIMPAVGALLWLDTVVGLRSVCSSEQHAMILINEAFKNFIEVLPHPSINSIDYRMYPDYAADETITHERGNWQPGDLLVHLPGMSLTQRIHTLPTYLPHIIR